MSKLSTGRVPSALCRTLPLLAALLLLAGAMAHGAAQAALPIPTPERLGGAERILLFLSTDKPIYKPGETVYARAVALKADTFFPVRHPQGTAALRITGPRKETLHTLHASLSNSTAGFAWTIPPGTAGGRYEASVSMDGSPVSVRPFEIRVYTPPRLKSQIAFPREGYGPGDTVTAVVGVTRAEGGIPLGAAVTAIARVDGVEAARVPGLAVDGEGNCRVSFVLPKEMERGEGTLAFVIEDGGVLETASKTIPILLQTLDIALYPEGGELISGLSSRVYVQARRPDGKPADIVAEVIRVTEAGAALEGKPVATLTTVHEGRGAFSFTPLAGERYALRLVQPSGITRLTPLPPALASGAVLHAEKETYAFADPLTLQVRATHDSAAALLTVFHRERLVAQSAVQPGENAVSLNAGEAEGVLMATVWDKNGKPLAERLLFRQPKFSVRVGITVEPLPAGGSPVPGGKVRMRVETTDESGRPVEAVVGLAVTDDALLEMVEKRDQAPSLPVMAYLENEVRDLADAHVYCDPANPQAGRNIDLLLGTQGWRRFVLARLDEALEKDPEGVRRALALRVPPSPPRPVAAIDREEQARAIAMAEQAREMGASRERMAPLQKFGLQQIIFDPIPGMDGEMLEEKPDALAEDPALPDAAKFQHVLGGENFPGILPAQKRIAPQAAKPVPHIEVREYAHAVRQGRKPNDRVDFSETLYWNAGIRTNPRDGTASVEFALSDSVTTFKVRADAFGNNGALGAADAGIASLEPFHTEPKLPPVLVAGDQVHAPAMLINTTADALERPNLIARIEGLSVGMSDLPETLAPDSRIRVLLTFTPEKAGEHGLSLQAAAGGYADTVTRPFTVLQRGFPIQQTASGIVGPEKPFSAVFRTADSLVPGSLSARAKIYPSPLANLEEALTALLRQPYGCFEQTSSTSYPLVMAQQYFLGHTGVDPEKIRKAGALLEESYKKLVAFECPEKGYEWFGGDPGHEALTAYGLMQFMEMDKVMPVDAGMLERTKHWLMSRRDGQGGFKRNERALDSFGAAPATLTNLYILWTLLESKEKPEGLRAEIDAAKKAVANTNDPYLLALGANILVLADDMAAARKAASSLQRAQDKDGSLSGAETTITRSGGESLLIETASLGVLAWLRCGETYTENVERAMAWLFERCKAGRFGSTQSTILALKAINAYDAARSRPKKPGSVQLLIDGKPFGHALTFTEDMKGALELPDFAAALTPGEHRIALRMTDGGDMPFALEIIGHALQPESGETCPLRLATALSARQTAEGEPVDLTVTLTAENENVHMPLAVIGLPAGLEPRHERLKELVLAGQMAAYEIRGRELVLYWRALAKGSGVSVTVPLTAEAPGVYTAPASRAYAYYLEEHKHWIAGERVEITAR